MWRLSEHLRLLFLCCVALAVVPIIDANTEENSGDQRFFDFSFISKDCGPKTSCDCESSNELCSAEEIMKYCEVCKGDLDIDYRFKGFTAFWMLKEVNGDMILHKEAVDVKAIELPQLKIIGGGMYLGGLKGNFVNGLTKSIGPEPEGSSCPYKFEYLNAPKLTAVGTIGTGIIQVGGYPYPDPVLQVNGEGLETASKFGGNGGPYVYTEGCPKLYKFSTPSLTHVGQCISFVNNDVLQTLAFPHLKSVGMSPQPDTEIPGTITIKGNDDLKLYHAPKALQHPVANNGLLQPESTQNGRLFKPEYYIKANPKLKLAVIMNNDHGKFSVDLTQNKDKAMALYMLPERKDTKHGGIYDGLYNDFGKFDAFDILPKGDNH